jgi:hypothetical protein
MFNATYVKDIIFVNVWRKNIFDIYVTEYGQLFYLFCSCV